VVARDDQNRGGDMRHSRSCDASNTSDDKKANIEIMPLVKLDKVVTMDGLFSNNRPVPSNSTIPL